MDAKARTGPAKLPGAAEKQTLPACWDAALAGKRLVQAFATLDRLPRLRGPREPGGHWPATITEWTDQLAQAELDESERRSRQRLTNRAIIRPSAAEIARMEEALDWLRGLRQQDPGMALVTAFWALRSARGRSIKALCAEKQWPPHTFFRKRAKALECLAQMLNSGGIPVS